MLDMELSPIVVNTPLNASRYYKLAARSVHLSFSIPHDRELTLDGSSEDRGLDEVL